MFASLFLLLILGLPLVFALGGLAVILIFMVWGPEAAVILYWNMMYKGSNFLLIAIPLFIFMASMLSHTGISEDLYQMMYRWVGRLGGGLAMGTVIICTLVAAMVGLSSAAMVTMGVTALPAMLDRGYSKQIAIGSIAAGGTLGILIPPSVIMIVYSMMASTSVGKLWLGGVLSGLLLSFLFIAYIGIRCFLQPEMGPPLSPEERSSMWEKLISLKAVALPLLLVVMVLGSVFLGIATPTEAAGVGAAGSILTALLHRKLTWTHLKQTNYDTIRLTCMIFWILIAGESFSALYTYGGASHFLKNTLLVLPFGRWGALIVIQLLLLFLGCFLDPWGIVTIALPVFIPVVDSLGFDLIWFGVLFVINMEMGYLTPPVGLNVFYMKGIVPKGTTMGEIFRSVFPFILVQAVAMALIMIFPQVVLWLPSVVIQ
jgi:tripartite ATP-independent transporter DctM subunit